MCAFVVVHFNVKDEKTFKKLIEKIKINYISRL